MKNVFSFLIAVVLLAVPASAQNIKYFSDTDESPALRIKNISQGNDTITITILSGGAASTNTVSDGTTTTTIDGSGATDTIAELAAAIAASADANSDLIVRVDEQCSIGTDSTDGELLDGTYTVEPGKWVSIPWDTSDLNWFSAYIPKGSDGGFLGGKDIVNLYGDLAATGTVAITIYEDRDPVWRATVAADAGNDTLDYFDNEKPLPAGGNSSVLIRAEATGTAATGLIGVIADPR